MFETRVKRCFDRPKPPPSEVATSLTTAIQQVLVEEVTDIDPAKAATTEAGKATPSAIDLASEEPPPPPRKRNQR